ncbi:meiosis-specific with OB domain-containing protein-like [Lingula anatina]|uniref:Meiosis-specific with OB domain-containing protein-like n=1 Tax=Lingula anatina TaxID=7574 RepID=A0A1S3H2H8_LINAN|nr:meiosis-specific with OB domain-containing protein-like [Lingula anatina]|eukprot:XP_013380147.1 meiosis-specific with OB domain-containing protein-like [Lingula anatina]
MAWSANFDDFNIDDNWPSPAQPQLDFYVQVIIGVVLAKEEPRAIPSKKNPGTELYLVSFTLRDSPVDFINATCWGNELHIQQVAELFHIGDIVEICNAQIASKPSDGSDERFRPWTPSLYQLNISENHSTVKLYGGWSVDKYYSLQSIPIKASNDFYTLGDIIANGQNLHNAVVNLLAVVRSVGSPKDIVTKNKKHLKRCEVKLLDETCLSFPLVLWSIEQVILAQSWTTQDQVIFVADARVNYDDYKKCMVATATSKTIFILNPDTREAHSLYTFAQSVDTSEDDLKEMLDVANSEIDLNTITNVYNLEQLKAKVEPTNEGGTDLGITYAYVTNFDIDGETEKVIARRCTKCRMRLEKNKLSCSNQNCPLGFLNDDTMEVDYDMQFDMGLTLSDCTGSMHYCRAYGSVVEKMLGCTADEFQKYDDKKKTQLKWKFLLEKCKLYIKVTLPRFDRPNTLTRILDCQVANPQEALVNQR